MTSPVNALDSGANGDDKKHLRRIPNASAAKPAEKARDNEWIADRLRLAATLLTAQHANVFRVSAYRHAADSIQALDTGVRTLAETGGHAALEAIPGVGRSIAGAIAEMLSTGRWTFLENLKGFADPEALFCSVPGVGPSLARVIHEKLHIETLGDLEAAAADGRLGRLPGFGTRRAAMVRAGLASLLAWHRPPRAEPGEEPAVGVLLDVDREYRERAAEGTLGLIAPRRFNPDRAAWLPVLHTERGEWHFTAMYSNTARAHQLGRTSDWVVIYFHQDGKPEGRRTVVTEIHGTSHGRRVVRGREMESQTLAVAPPPSRHDADREA